MKKSYFSFLLLSLLLISCNKLGIKYWPIPVEQLFGTYDLWNGKEITFNPDYTYVYFNGATSDTGIWRYQYLEPPFRLNIIAAYDMRALSKDGEKKYYTEFKTHHFYACKHWRKIIITNGYEGDPDGAPALKWYKKVK